MVQSMITSLQIINSLRQCHVWEERALAMLTFDQGLINEFEAGLRQMSI